MADYHATIRTNYFSVTDEAKFREIIASCNADNAIEIFENVQEDGSKKFGFGCYGSINGIPPVEDDDDDDSIDALYDALQSILCKGDAILITEIGSENLRYLVGCCVVITSYEIRVVDVMKEALKLAKDILGNESFETKCDY